jgi:hypothetical protein
LVQMWGVQTHVVPGSGQAIDRCCITQMLDRWLAQITYFERMRISACVLGWPAHKPK